MAAVVAATTAVAAAAASMNHVQRIKNALWRDPRDHIRRIYAILDASLVPTNDSPADGAHKTYLRCRRNNRANVPLLLMYSFSSHITIAPQRSIRRRFFINFFVATNRPKR